jgi:hypothetical protein
VNIKKPLPLLFLFCQNDALVSPTACLSRLNELFPTGIPKSMETITLKGTNHGFKRSELCYTGAYKNIPFSEEGRLMLREWIKKYGY